MSPNRRNSPRRHHSKGRPEGPRMPPPEATGLEAAYLQYRVDAALPTRVRLRDGQSIDGVIREFDRSVLTIEAADGVPVTIPKAEIGYLEEIEES